MTVPPGSWAPLRHARDDTSAALLVISVKLRRLSGEVVELARSLGHVEISVSRGVRGGEHGQRGR